MDWYKTQKYKNYLKCKLCFKKRFWNYQSIDLSVNETDNVAKKSEESSKEDTKFKKNKILNDLVAHAKRIQEIDNPEPDLTQKEKHAKSKKKKKEKKTKKKHCKHTRYELYNGFTEADSEDEHYYYYQPSTSKTTRVLGSPIYFAINNDFQVVKRKIPFVPKKRLVSPELVPAPRRFGGPTRKKRKREHLKPKNFRSIFLDTKEKDGTNDGNELMKCSGRNSSNTYYNDSPTDSSFSESDFDDILDSDYNDSSWHCRPQADICQTKLPEHVKHHAKYCELYNDWWWRNWWRRRYKDRVTRGQRNTF